MVLWERLILVVVDDFAFLEEQQNHVFSSGIQSTVTTTVMVTETAAALFCSKPIHELSLFWFTTWKHVITLETVCY